MLIDPPIEITSNGEYNIIPGYIEDLPNGYKSVWTLKKPRFKYDTCYIRAKHINEGQNLKARFYIDNMPKKIPVFSCPMKELEIDYITQSEVRWKVMANNFLKLSPLGLISKTLRLRSYKKEKNIKK